MQLDWSSVGGDRVRPPVTDPQPFLFNRSEGGDLMPPDQEQAVPVHAGDLLL